MKKNNIIKKRNANVGCAIGIKICISLNINKISLNTYIHINNNNSIGGKNNDKQHSP